MSVPTISRAICNLDKGVMFFIVEYMFRFNMFGRVIFFISEIREVFIIMYFILLGWERRDRNSWGSHVFSFEALPPLE